jgi:hypothetical protein
MRLRNKRVRRTIQSLLVLSVCGFVAATSADVRAVWTRIYNAPTNHADTDPAVVADPAGAVYVAACCYDPNAGDYTLRAIKYSAAGEIEWQRAAAHSALPGVTARMTLDSAGNLLVTGRRWEAGWGAVLLKYSPDGTPLLDIYYPVSGVPCGATPLSYPALATDAADNIFLGWSDDCDFVVLKFSAAGTFLWDAKYGLPGNTFDRVIDLAVDAAGNAYAIGTLGTGGEPYGVVAFDSAGAYRWSDDEGGPIGNGFEKAFIRVNPSGEIYAGGSVETTCGVFQFRVWKYAANGTRAWTRWYTDEPCDSAEPRAMAVDAFDNVVLAGERGGAADFATVKWDASGNRRWVGLLDGSLHSTDVAYAVAVDSSGNVYTAGERLDAGLNYNYGVVAYAPNGAVLWSRTYDGPLHSTDRATGIAANARGVFVTGDIWNGSTTNYDVATIKYFLDHPGDLNCDGIVGFGDINPFVLALSNPAAYSLQFAGCNIQNGDINGDSHVDFADINPFVQLLSQSSP